MLVWGDRQRSNISSKVLLTDCSVRVLHITETNDAKNSKKILRGYQTAQKRQPGHPIDRRPVDKNHFSG